MSLIKLNGISLENSFVFWGGGDYSASSQASGFPAINAGTQDTYAQWKPATSGLSWIQVDKGVVGYIDSVGVANHNLATSGIGSVLIQYSSNGSTWSNIGSISTVTDKDFIAVFPQVMARYVRLSFNGPTASIGVFQAAKRLNFEHGVDIGYTPIQHSMNYTKEFENSITGQFLTNHVIARGASTEAKIDMQSRGFVELAMRPFEDHYNKGGCFFFAGEVVNMPDDMGYCQAGSNDATVNVKYLSGGKYANVSFSLNVFVGA